MHGNWDTSQNHTEGSFSGPALTIMSFNVQWLSAAKQQLIADLRHRLQCAVVCMQNTHRGPDDIRPSIPGMELAIDKPHSQYGSAIYLTSGTTVNRTSLTDINNIEILGVDLNSLQTSSKCHCITQPHTTPPGCQPHVIVGDSNSHSLQWGYATTNIDGELVEGWAETHPLSLIHDPKLPSSFNSGWSRLQSRPHLCYQPNCRQQQKIVMDPVPRSQHRPIGVQVKAAVNIRTVPFRRRFNLKKANWERYAHQPDAAVRNVPPTSGCYDQFVGGTIHPRFVIRVNATIWTIQREIWIRPIRRGHHRAPELDDGITTLKMWKSAQPGRHPNIAHQRYGSKGT